MRAIVIDPAARTASEADIETDYRSLQAAVGGSIETAHEFGNGDVLYVCEDGFEHHAEAIEGRREAAKACFFDVGAHQPFAGKGVVVGREGPDGRHGGAVTPLAELQRRLTFMQPPAMLADETRPQ